MSFIDFGFFVFLSAVFILYFIAPKKYRWLVLLLSSYVFYALADIRMTALLIIITAVVFVCGIWMDNTHRKQKKLFDSMDANWLKHNKKHAAARFMKKRRAILLISLLTCFGTLAFLKYYNFAAINLNILGMNLPLFHTLLPLGISFYSFQSLGYAIDIYRGKYPADRNFFKFALFVSFFPQIVQGPISRYDELARQLYAPNEFEYTRAKYGVQLIAWGYLKKLVIADRAFLLADLILTNFIDYSGAQVVLGLLAATLQVYTDFSGGIDITRGIAQVLGIDMPENFTRPFFSCSLSEYWRRWHITLGTWMRDYLLYPLSLSKPFGKLGKWSRKIMGNYFGKLFPTCLAMFVVFLAVGIWHGAEWRFIVFGIYNGIIIVGGILIAPLVSAFQKKHPNIRVDVPFWRVLICLKTFALVFIGKYFSAATDLSQAFALMKHSLFNFFSPSSKSASLSETFGHKQFFIFFAMAVFLFFVSLFQERGLQIRDVLAKQHIVIRWTVYFAILFLILIFAMDDTQQAKGFVYANF